ncbi:TrmH family RNA methyltransferase [Leekyejoonella antrihumi]|uniref:RNA methyltransferase n=1 Tax=Leekyejoonella antrihumi TaxID=1660198 RepID=A0A563E6K2_9MICO|nr:TrmH family RNA methyltransferase [Leekyejoonella antrihumi]TWP38188.1 RNA methyltransferase [Leekyejoonella antrihumi]
MQVSPPDRPGRIGSRNAAYQQLETLLHNRTKRHRAGEFIVQGVRPIGRALEYDWTIRTLIRPEDRRPSDWARGVWECTRCHHVQMPEELLAQLAEKADDVPELLAVVEMPPDDLERLPSSGSPLIVVFDRPGQPGNIGSLLRSMDAFGASALVVTGHAADPYDPKSVRASTGSFFTVPTVRAESHREVLEWVTRRRVGGIPLTVLGTDEGGEQDLRRVDLAGPTVIVIGNETRGLTRAWRDGCDQIISIPMVGTASSLNAATAGAIVLHEALRQRTP